MNVDRPFMAKYIYNVLELKQNGNNVDRIGTTLFNSKINLTPHQIEAALFAFNSPISKGCILADEVGLGKTIEAGIVLAQLWNEHKRRILIICPASLMRQWAGELEEKFNLPSIIMDRKNYNSIQKSGYPNPFLIKNTIIICSYQMCANSENDIKNADFDLCVIDEAHKLRNVWTGKNIVSTSIKNALLNTKKILLTATPIQNNVMDLYGLTTLIDDNIFGDAKIYREKYYKDYVTNLVELRNRLNNFTHRTLREQVQPYVKFTKRIPKTFTFEQTEDETKVYNMIRELLLNSDKESYLIPNKQKHLLLLILCKLMGSSIHSIVYTLETMKNRLEKLLETGIDEGIDDLIDEDYEEDFEDSDEDVTKEIDKEELMEEIKSIDKIIDTAKRVNVESKYLALKDAIKFGNKFLRELNANDKILIFTESRRTQLYLYQTLLDEGYDEVILFNGSNSDEISKKIYEEWCAKPENFEKLNNSKTVNMRQAIIDYFKEKGKILIATGAGAEGLNLQFCSMVINYDLPWNPQVVEQRIGRCHRFGQIHDVVVINFISSTNAVEQRIYELLSSKFRVFNEVLGSSDSILGTLEEGIDLEKAIVEVYTKCRTVEEINNAFDEIQNRYKDVIDESIKKTKQELLDNFDEDIQGYFAELLDETNSSINRVEEMFWKLTKIALNEKAKFNENTKTFTYENENYCLSTMNNGKFIDYNMNSILGQKVLNEISKISENKGDILFDITNYPYKITDIQDIKGCRGYISLNKVSIDSFEKEEKLFFSGFLSDGTQISEDIIEKLFRLNTIEKTSCSINFEISERLSKDAEQYSKKIVIESEERNNKLLNDEIAKINKWAEDKIESVQLKVELMRNERKNLQKQSDIAESSYEKEKIEEEILKLSKRIKSAWLELADAEEEIELQRNSTIKKLREQVMKSYEVTNLFTVSFGVI